MRVEEAEDGKRPAHDMTIRVLVATSVELMKKTQALATENNHLRKENKQLRDLLKEYHV
jgi:regulator of replication initiation timing